MKKDFLNMLNTFEKKMIKLCKKLEIPILQNILQKLQDSLFKGLLLLLTKSLMVIELKHLPLLGHQGTMPIFSSELMASASITTFL